MNEVYTRCIAQPMTRYLRVQDTHYVDVLIFGFDFLVLRFLFLFFISGVSVGFAEGGGIAPLTLRPPPFIDSVIIGLAAGRN